MEKALEGAITCAFCGHKKHPRIAKAGTSALEFMAPVINGMDGIEIATTIKFPAPYICYDCIIQFHSEIEAEENDDVDLPIKHELCNRIIFTKGKWHMKMKNNTTVEILRSEAMQILESNGLKHRISMKSWKDVIKPDQPIYMQA